MAIKGGGATRQKGHEERIRTQALEKVGETGEGAFTIHDNAPRNTINIQSQKRC